MYNNNETDYRDNYGYQDSGEAYPYEPGQDQYVDYYPQEEPAYYPEEDPNAYQPGQDPYQGSYEDPYPDYYGQEDAAYYPEEEASEPASPTARQKQMKLLGLVLFILIVLVVALLKGASPKPAGQPGQAGQQAHVDKPKEEVSEEAFHAFRFQLPGKWKALEAANPEQAEFTCSYVPAKSSKNEIFTVYTKDPSQQAQAALASLSEEEILTSYLEAVQQDSQVHEFSILEDHYPLGLAHRSFSYKFSQEPDLAYVVNTVLLKDGQLYVWQSSAEESEKAWVDSTHADILNSLKLD